MKISKLIKELNQWMLHYYKCADCALSGEAWKLGSLLREAAKQLEEYRQKLEDEVQTVHAHWIEHEWAEEQGNCLISNFECSSCHGWHRDKTNFCPDCGAKMDNM